jgi:very-short-patch-repair endonuclease
VNHRDDPKRTARKHLARALRRELTPAEAILRREVRDRRLGGYKFRRQQPLGPFYADFYSAEAKLVVELDGDSHVGREESDAARTAYFNTEGIAIVRFWNPELSDNLDGVLTVILAACTARAPNPAHHAPVGSPPSPLGGEGRGEARGVRGRTTHGEDPTTQSQSR